jgi:hypothetical protein
MSTAVAVLPESPTSIGISEVPPFSENSLYNLIHELRQPLSAMESIAYYLELTVPVEQVQLRRQISRLQQLVMEASMSLSEAVRESRAAH